VSTPSISGLELVNSPPGELTFGNVTVIHLSKPFYDKHIFIGSPFLRGPGWGNVFNPKGALIQMALHHEIVSAEPRALREAVEARWQAFRGQPKAAASLAAGDDRSAEPARTSLPAAGSPGIGNMPEARSPSRATPRMSAWEIAKLIVLLIGIAVALAKLLGVWATPGRRRRAKHGRSGRIGAGSLTKTSGGFRRNRKRATRSGKNS
jgi:hypothetical protein